MNIGKLWLICSFAFAMSVQGCIDYQETIEVKPDGSIELTVYATVVKAAMPMVKNRPELRQLMLLPAEASSARRMLPEGVEIVHWVIEDGDGIRIIDAKVSIRSLQDLQQNIGLITSSQNFRLFRNNDGFYVYKREVPAYPIDPNLGVAKGFLEKRLANSNLQFTLKVPTGYARSNGKAQGRSTVVWQTDLTKLRNNGFSMDAVINPPPLISPWQAAGAGLLAVFITSLLIFNFRKTS